MNEGLWKQERKKKMSRKIVLDMTLDLPDGFRFGIYESCRANDSEPYCVHLTKEIGRKCENHAAFSAVSFGDAFVKCMEKFNTEKSVRYWAA